MYRDDNRSRKIQAENCKSCAPGRGRLGQSERRMNPAARRSRKSEGRRGRSSFASGDSFQAAHLTVETRRARREGHLPQHLFSASIASLRLGSPPESSPPLANNLDLCFALLVPFRGYYTDLDVRRPQRGLPASAFEVRKPREEDPKRKKQEELSGEEPEEKTREEEGNMKPAVLW